MTTTPFAAVHESLGASFTDFAGWQMPVRYGSETAEHHAVRQAAGLFDLCHMGEIELDGPQAAAALDYALVGNASAIAVGRAKYSMIVDTDGGIIDDLIVYRLADEHFLVIANASNADVVFDAVRERAQHGPNGAYDTTVRNTSEQWALIAVQGPASVAVLQPLSDIELASLKYYSIARGSLDGHDVWFARTGYTGEDGFEVLCSVDEAVAIWESIAAAGAAHGLVPCGLACRDTLRLEAGMPLYGHELGRDLTPFDAGLGRVVVFGKPDGFLGEAALAPARDAEPARRLVGLVTSARRSPRAGYAVVDPASGEEVGEVTSGSPSPTLGHPIAMAYVRADLAEPGTSLAVSVRGASEDVEVVALPFYKRTD